MVSMRDHKELLLFVTSTALLVAGGVAYFADAEPTADWSWYAGTVLGLVASVIWTLDAFRDRRPTVDVIAVVALAGAMAVGEPFAGAMVTVMLASGQLLEARAQGRARRELGLLLERVPRTARRRTSDGYEEVEVGVVVPGERLVVGSGEIVPVDGRLLCDAVVDESALTGEPLPVEREAGEDIRSGVVNAGTPLELVATQTAADSTYAGVVRLVEEAQATTAPFVRLADRLATYFVPLTAVVAGGAWLVSGDPVRAVAVLVVATPCPLLLAAPIAIMSGLSRAARSGVVIKGGEALERLAAGEVLLFDKTGTLTRGQPEVSTVVVGDAAGGADADEVLRLAASLEQVSPHVLAGAIVSAALHRGLALELPQDVVEHHGYGLSGRVGDVEVRVGKPTWVATGDPPPWVRRARRRADLDGSLVVFVGVAGEAVGAFLLEDPVRADAPRMVRGMRDAGLHRVVLVTGDRADTAEAVGRIIGVDAVHAECDPGAKLSLIRVEGEHGPTIMVGDGVNDAPALAAADVGVALAARGATASSEAADVVLTVDRVDALADAILISRRSRRIALQAVVTGMVLSVVAMGLAAVGLVPPAAGAVLQEVIDLLAIAIALRALTPGERHTIAMTSDDVELAHRLRLEHDAVLDVVEQIRAVADELSTEDCDLAPVHQLMDRLDVELLPHERSDEELLVPLMARALGGSAATTALSRTHAEIEHQVGRLRRLLEDVDAEDLAAGGAARGDEVIELRRLLYGLYAVLRLHNAQEEEGAFSLVPAGAAARPAPPARR